MRSKVIFHPRMTAVQIEAFCAIYGCTVEVDFSRNRMRVHLHEPEPTLAPETSFECERCDWMGPDPRWVDTQGHFPWASGDIPACPACGSYQVMLIFEESNKAEVHGTQQR